ncbi:peptidoglycan-binding protein [Pendulispora brunnea]|uniref:Peptidoglycan-binding protein n=1 Tax=Pendulispora brunnea TaxID=2905690 RepID=A0ABZ2KFZ5_9BACT
MRTMPGSASYNTVRLPTTIPVRFQLAPGTGPNLGIANADYTVGLEGEPPLAQGKTDATGQVPVLLAAFWVGTPIIEILGTRYEVHLHSELASIKTLAGVQKRLDALGYMTGYQLVPIGDAEPADGVDGARTQQAILNFQSDHEFVMNGFLSNETLNAIDEAFQGKGKKSHG